MSAQFYPNGIGGSAPGDSLDLVRPLQMSGNIWYVSSLIGTDAGGSAGQNREKPLATVAQAVTNSANEDIIVFLAGHTESLSAVQNVAKSLTFIGEGTTSGKPAVSFVTADAVSNTFNVTAAAVEFRNIYFPQHTINAPTFKMVFSGGASDGLVRGCYFDCGPTDLASQLIVAESRLRIESTTFISTAISRAAQPFAAIFGSAGVFSGLTMRDVVVSAGTVGFSNYAAIDLSASTFTRVRIENLNLLLGADMAMPVGSTGRINVQTSTGGSRVAWS